MDVWIAGFLGPLTTETVSLSMFHCQVLTPVRLRFLVVDKASDPTSFCQANPLPSKNRDECRDTDEKRGQKEVCRRTAGTQSSGQVLSSTHKH